MKIIFIQKEVGSKEVIIDYKNHRNATTYPTEKKAQNEFNKIVNGIKNNNNNSNN